MNFNRVTRGYTSIGTTAQTTLMYRLIQHSGPGVLRTVIRYCLQRLDEVNDALPDSDPGKQRALTKRKVYEGPNTAHQSLPKLQVSTR